MKKETFLTTAEAAKRLDICPDTLRQLARAGKLKYATVIGRRGQRLFTQGEVERLRLERQAGRRTVNNGHAKKCPGNAHGAGKRNE